LSEPFRILIPLFAGLVVFLLVMRGVFALVRRKLMEEVKAKFVGKTIIRQSIGANFFGRTSKGIGQIRGNGALVLTPDELYFIMFAPRRELSIPLRDIVSVSTPRSHLGKTPGFRLLKVDFKSENGKDAAAWALKEVDDWTSDIERWKPRN
jgi:hypothetical protein